jgi:hypothetical protein
MSSDVSMTTENDGDHSVTSLDNRGNKGSGVWRYMKKLPDGNSASCSMCTKITKCNGGSTKGCREHLKAHHGISTEELGQARCECILFNSVLYNILNIIITLIL